MEAWGKEIFLKGVGVKFQDGGIENPIYYLAFRSKITPALQAKSRFADSVSNRVSLTAFF